MATTINDLTATTSVDTADQFAVWDAGDQTTKRAPGSQVLAWLQSALTFTAAKPVQQFAVPLTGTTVTVATGDSWLVVTPAGTLAALTISLPTDRTDGETVLVNSTQTLTSLTVSGAGTTVVGAPTTLTANGFFEMRYTSTLNAWYRTT